MNRYIIISWPATRISCSRSFISHHTCIYRLSMSLTYIYMYMYEYAFHYDPLQVTATLHLWTRTCPQPYLGITYYHSLADAREGEGWGDGGNGVATPFPFKRKQKVGGKCHETGQKQKKRKEKREKPLFVSFLCLYMCITWINENFPPNFPLNPASLCPLKPPPPSPPPSGSTDLFPLQEIISYN